MSGYRSLHRENIHQAPIWDVEALRFFGKSSSKSWSILTGSGDGLVRLHHVNEKVEHAVSSGTDDLNASALALKCSHFFIGKNQVVVAPGSDHSHPTVLGTSQCSAVRNYVGEDDMAGDVVVASLDLSGRVRVWTCPAEELIMADQDQQQQQQVPITIIEPKQIKALHEFVVTNATGTLLKLCPPKLTGNGPIMVAVALLDGSIVMVATGLVTPKSAPHDATKEAGMILQYLGTSNNTGSIAMSMAWHPNQAILAVGRKDGLIDILPLSKQGNSHCLIQHGSKVRAICYTPDGQLLISASDDGFLAVWDVNRKSPTLVHHVVDAHSSWILDVTPLSDSRRFVTAGADGKLHVWSVGQIYAPMHTFQTTEQIWTLSSSRDRLVCGSEHGWLQIYSLEEK